MTPRNGRWRITVKSYLWIAIVCVIGAAALFGLALYASLRNL